MYKYTERKRENKNNSSVNSFFKNKPGDRQGVGLVDNRHQVTQAVHHEQVIQGMSFTRFRGLSRILNWTYNDEEKTLLLLENKAVELIDGLDDYYKESLSSRLPNEYKELKEMLGIIREGAYDSGEYKDIESELKSIIQKGDGLSSKLAFFDLPLEEGFDLAQEKAIPKEKYGISKDMTLEQFLTIIQSVAKRESLSDLVQLRELTDIFVQFFSDAMMKFNPELRSAVVLIKSKVLDASTNIHIAYLYASLKKDMKSAESYYLRGVINLVHSIEYSSGLFSKLSQDSQGKAYPKYREAINKPYESAAIMLASAFLKDGFIPDFVIGLPTGGVHAAHRVVAALTIITGKKPTMWTTRPQGVKQESKDFMKDTDKEDVFTRDEKRYLSYKLPKGKTNIAIVDDGFISGETLRLTKEIYKNEFEGYGPVDIRTGAIEAGHTQMGSDYNGKENPADYVVVCYMGMAGKTGALNDMVNDENTKSYDALEPKSKGTVAILSGRSSFSELTIEDILDGK